MILDHLQKIGLTEKEASVYIACLELGEATVQQIATASKVNRITTHVAIEKLSEMGLVREIKRGKRRRIIAEMPRKLIDRLLDKKIETERQVTELEQVLPELESIYNYSNIKPKIRFYEGLSGLQQVYQDSLNVGEEIVAFTAYHAADENLAQWLDEYYVPERVKRGIHAKVIAPSSAYAGSKQAADKKQKRETALLPVKDFPLSIEVNVYGNKVSIISFATDEMMAVVIESKEVAATFKLIFKLAWTSAQQYSK